jgi:Protein of unknown function (DUF1460)
MFSRQSLPFLALFLASQSPTPAAAEPQPSVVTSAVLPFKTIFVGKNRFDQLIAKADPWVNLPIGERVATVGHALLGTPYRGFTLEIDDTIESPSANFLGLDCWTFFEVSLAFARMLNEPSADWTPQTLLKYLELDRYRGGHCHGYLSRLHYLEDWLQDNERRNLVQDLTRRLGGVRAPHAAEEMQRAWKSYRYMRNSPEIREGITAMENRIARTPLYYIPKNRVATIEPQIQSGDIICICSHDGNMIGTSHVGLAYRTPDNVLHFLHASAPQNFGKVVLDQQLSGYLEHFKSAAGIMVARPLK